MPSGPPHALPAFLLEDADLRTSHLAVDDPDDSSIGDEGRPGHHRTIGLLDEENLMEGHFLTGPGLETVDNDGVTRHDFDLPPAALNDGVHVHPFRRSTHGTRERAPSALKETISVLLLRKGCKDRATRPAVLGARVPVSLPSRYLRSMRVPRIVWVLSALRNVGRSRSISSKYDERAGVFCDAS